MSDAPVPEPSLARITQVTMAVWLVIGLTALTAQLPNQRIAQPPLPSQALFWLTWLLLTPAVTWWTKFVSDHWHGLHLPIVHAISAALASALHLSLWTAADFGAGAEISWSGLLILLRREMVFGPMLYICTLTAVHAMQHYFRHRDQAVIAARAASDLARTELLLYQRNLQPRILLDILERADLDVERNPERTERSLIAISSLLRLMLDRIEVDEVTLEEDLQLGRSHLAVLSSVAGEAIREEFTVERGAEELLVPNFLFQEILHSLAGSSAPRLVKVQVGMENPWMLISIGAFGYASPAPLDQVSTLAAQFESRCGARFHLQRNDEDEHSLQLQLKLPLRRLRFPIQEFTGMNRNELLAGAGS